jgi:heat shock protein HslJ
VTETLEIASFKKTCEGVGQSQCLQVRKEGQRNWAYFYNTIEGFEYIPGYKYTIDVLKETIGPKKIPADASSFKYTLLKQIRKRQEPTIRLHDIWVLKTIHNESINQVQITLEIHLNDSKILGNDSCNNFFGVIEQVNDSNLQFGLLGRTKKICPDMTAANTFYETMQEVASYRIEKLNLYLLNSNDEEIMKLLKVD